MLHLRMQMLSSARWLAPHPNALNGKYITHERIVDWLADSCSHMGQPQARLLALQVSALAKIRCWARLLRRRSGRFERLASWARVFLRFRCCARKLH